MNKIIGIVLMAFMLGLLSGCEEGTSEEAADKKVPATEVEDTAAAPAPGAEQSADTSAVETLGSELEKLSYSMGLDLGKYLSQVDSEIDLEAIKLGLEDGFSGVEPKMSEAELSAVQAAFAERMKLRQAEELAQIMEKNLAAGKAYLEENAQKQGVMVTESGLQYEVLEQGAGEKPRPEQTVKVDYVGTLIDGTEFDSSIKRGEPITFGVDQVVPGWSEALQLMTVGSTYRVAIPSELAYGESGAPPVIQPNSVLVFEISLLGIEPETAVTEITESSQPAAPDADAAAPVEKTAVAEPANE